MKTTRALGILALAAVATRITLDRKRAYNYANRLVVISGGARGLGLILARQLIRRGARVAICARDESELSRAVEHLALLVEREGRGDVFGERCDIKIPGQVTSFIESVRAWGGPIDVLINNAGVMTVGPAETMLGSDYEEAFDVHLRGPLALIEAVLPDMRAHGEGRIVNIGSVGGLVAFPHMAPYCASKHALVGLSNALRIELVRENIFVTTVNPGLMRTGSHVNARFKGAHQFEQTVFSLANANPLFSVNAERAAHRILEGARKGRARVRIGWLPFVLGVLDHLAPETVQETLALAESFAPHPRPVVSVARSGRKSASPLSPSIFTSLSDSQVATNNE
jgi:NAD(P)-dependent dehydrogenase (short-subunit alcohol dehydrogenase family)